MCGGLEGGCGVGSSCLLHFLVCYNLYATLKINKNTEYKKKKKWTSFDWKLPHIKQQRIAVF